ncbi:hypothetical protein ACFP9V_22780 [Deinococcus radiopugnans]|uniref:Uncharacterized protein n=1 Tax=Deinococcus radiopugnans ATCC 19172 TaxID=585398 RepID=A0A5C4Y5W0_9DEIO|nr:hypothetical protein [Deinococcus radiopugnans]MBB6017085.1 hypothetical protein [Deinococcus radiopugnans ATCC 19172]TNM70681.1 hypothetical protein FHR04_12335 [Deinococcus radiopugnans ATCC 19172]
MQNLSLGELAPEPGRTLVRRTVTLRRIEAGEVTQIELLDEYGGGEPAQDQGAAPPPIEEP